MRFDGRTDSELLDDIVAGDADALAALYDRHVTTLYPIALRIVGARWVAEDILHDVFVAVSERAAHQRAIGGLVVSWLGKLVRALSMDRVRQQRPGLRQR